MIEVIPIKGAAIFDLPEQELGVEAIARLPELQNNKASEERMVELDPPQVIFVIWRALSDGEAPGREYVDMHWACKGGCDRMVGAEVRARNRREIVDGWEDISDYCIPVVYIQRMMALVNGLHNGDQWSDSAFDKLKTLIIAAYPHIARHTTTSDKGRIKRLLRILSFLGGLGYEE